LYEKVHELALYKVPSS